MSSLNPSSSPPKSSEAITIKLRNPAGDLTFYKIKRSTRLGKVLKDYASRLGVHQNSLSFMVDDERIMEDSTADMLCLVNGEDIPVRVDQMGC